MIGTQESLAPPTSTRLGLLARDFQARMLNYSPTGCLLETNARLEVGTIGSLCFVSDSGFQLRDGALQLAHVGVIRRVAESEHIEVPLRNFELLC